MRAVCTLRSFKRTLKFGVNARRAAGQRIPVGPPLARIAMKFDEGSPSSGFRQVSKKTAMVHGIPACRGFVGSDAPKPPAEPRPPNAVGPEFCKTNANPSVPWKNQSWCVSWNWNVVSKPDLTGCFSRNQTAPVRFGRARVRRKTFPELAASPTRLSPWREVKPSKRIPPAARPIKIAIKKYMIQAQRVPFRRIQPAALCCFL
jgi:hypothetical protein